MSEERTDLAQEQARLALVLQEIERQQADVERVADGHWGSVTESRKSMWQDLPHHIHSFDDLVVMSQHALILGEKERDFALYQKIAENLKRMHASPYFGRIDFQERGYSEVEPIYIGISSLVHGESGEHLVYDWRAPVSSMFYDSELGTATYDCDAGTITGELLLKRQYKIADGELLYCFDTNVKIDDDVLQEILAKHVDDKMRHIVTSIQREQNQIIRDERHPVLIVQGPAGSGKTSIALHRAAYLLYRFRNTMSAQNVLIFSPNDVFSDYISNVLPELGEEPVGQVTFIQYAQQSLGHRFRLEEMAQQMEYLLSQRGTRGYDIRVKGIRYKASAAFLQVIENYVRHLETGSNLPFRDVRFHGELVMGRAEMLDRLQNRYPELPYAKRLGMIQRRIEFLLEEPLKAAVGEVAKELAADPESMGLSNKEIRRRSRRIVNGEMRATQESMEAWSKVDVFSLYRSLFADRKLFQQVAEGTSVPPEMDAIRRDTLRRYDQRQLGLEDVAPLMYLSLLVDGAPASSNIRHVIVDEAQDYSLFHYKVLRGLFPQSSFTILGDMNQSVHPHMNSGSYEGIMGSFANPQPHLIELRRTYRSTRQIAEFTQAILAGRLEVESIQREGDKPRVMRVNPAERIDMLAAEIARMQAEGAGSIAVVCKTAATSQTIYDQLRSKVDVALIEHDDTNFRTGVLVLPVYLAKGLEFDGVIVCDASAETYGHEDERKALYTACTRALHQLTLDYSEKLSPFVAAPDSGLYAHIS